jgi:prevent-host-death family protein
MTRPKVDILAKKNVDLLEDHQSVSARHARSNFSGLINTARIDKEVVVITDHGEPAAAIIPISDLRILDRFMKMDWKDRVSNADFKEMSPEQLKEFILGDITGKAATRGRPGVEDVNSDETQE